MEAKDRVNIYDIAKSAGVSIATVSRVLSGGAKVSEATRDRVLSVIEQRGYVPNAFARGLGLGSMKLVGILCSDVSDIYYAKAVSNLEHHLSQSSLNALLYCTGNTLAGKKKGLDILLSKNVDAIILAGSPFIELGDNRHILAAAAQTPVFCVNGCFEGPNIYSVLCDEFQGMYMNAEHLIRAGCRNILYLYDAQTVSGRSKLEGFRKAHLDANLIVNERLVVQSERELHKIAERTKALLAQGESPDGILASEDIFIIGASKALSRTGAAPPAIGFNNSVIAECATPAITSMDNMLDTLCQIVCSLLNDVLDGKTVPQKITVSPHLVQRDTFKVQTSDTDTDQSTPKPKPAQKQSINN